MGNRTLLLARHGDYTLTIEFPQNPDGSLNALGQKQAALLATRLQSTKLDAIYSSPLLRAHETTRVVAQYHPTVPLHVDDDLQECIPNVPLGLEKHFAEIPASFIESGPAQAERVFTTYFTPLSDDAPDRTELIVTHGNLLGYLIARTLDAPAESWLRPDMGNCCISEIRIRANGMMKLVRHNDGAHIPPNLEHEE